MLRHGHTMSVAALGEVAEMYKHNRELFVQATGPVMARRIGSSRFRIDERFLGGACARNMGWWLVA